MVRLRDPYKYGHKAILYSNGAQPYSLPPAIDKTYSTSTMIQVASTAVKRDLS